MVAWGVDVRPEPWGVYMGCLVGLVREMERHGADVVNLSCWRLLSIARFTTHRQQRYKCSSAASSPSIISGAMNIGVLSSLGQCHSYGDVSRKIHNDRVGNLKTRMTNGKGNISRSPINSISDFTCQI
eukprot:2653466-Amphidinium_carterae.1